MKRKKQNKKGNRAKELRLVFVCIKNLTFPAERAISKQFELP